MQTSRIAYIIFAILGIIVAAVNVGGDYVIHFIDIYWPATGASAINEVRSFFASWSTENLGGYTAINIFNLPPFALIAFLYILKIPVYIQEIVVIGALQFLSMAYSYRILKDFILENGKESHNLVSFFGAIGITMNYSVMVVIWWDFIPNGFFLIGFGAAFIYYLLCFSKSYIRDGKFDFTSALLLFIFAALSFSVNLPFNMSLIYLTLVLTVFAMVFFSGGRRYIWRYATYVLTVGVLIFLSNLWWILPNVIFVFTSPALSASSSYAGNIGIYYSTTSGITIKSVIDGLYGYIYTPFFKQYSGSLNDFIYGLGKFFIYNIPAVLITGISVILHRTIRDWISKGKHNDSRLIRHQTHILIRRLEFFLVSFIPIAFVIAGGLGIDGIIDSLFRSSVIQTAIRNPIVSLSISYFWILIISVSVAIALIIDHIRGNGDSIHKMKYVAHLRSHSRFVTVAASILVVVFLVFPIVTASSDIYTGYAIPHFPYRSRMVVPQFDTEVSSYLKSHAGDHYVLLYPGGFLEQNISGGYDAYDVLPDLMPNNLVIDSVPGGLAGTQSTLISEIYSLIGGGEIGNFNVSGALQQLNIAYIVVEGDLGGKYPEGSISQPNYPIVLKSLNETLGLTLAEKIGPDYIYKTNVFGSQIATIDNYAVLNNSEDFSPALNYTPYFYNSSLTYSSPFTGLENITRIYFNDTLSAVGNIKNEILPTWDNGLVYSLNSSEKNYLQNTSDPLPLGPPNAQPSLFNILPLHLNASEYPMLMINFTTNGNTALNFEGVAQGNLNESNIENGINLGYYSTMPSDQKVNPYYGGLKYNGTGTIYFNLAQALSGSSNKTLNYIIISVYPTYNNGTGMHLPMNQWPGYQNFTIKDIYAGIGSGTSLQSYPLISLGENPNEAPGLHNEILPTWDNGLVYSLNSSEKNYLQNTSDPLPLGPPNAQPSLFNILPLHLNASEYPMLMINFTTNGNTALNFEGVAQGNLNESNIENGINLGYYSTMPSDQKVNPYYGGLKYNGTGTIYFNLAQALSGSSNKTLNYIIISVYPTYNNGTGMHLPMNQWPGYQNFTIGAIYAGYNYFMPPQNNDNLKIANSIIPSGVAPIDSYNGSILYTVSIALPRIQVPLPFQSVMKSPLDYEVTVKISNSGYPFFVVLSQNYFPGWTVSGSGVASFKAVVVDGSLNGFLIYPKGNATNISFQVIFSAQGKFQLSLEAGMISFVAPLTIFCIFYVYKRKYGISKGNMK